VTLPGVSTTIGESLPSTSLPSSTGTAFVVGPAERGPVDVPIPLLSMAQYASKCGSRVSYSTIYDTLDVAFDRGLNQAYFVRRVGPSAVTAHKDLVDSESANTLEIKATSPGEWANTIVVEVVAGVAEGSFKLKVLEGEDLKESSTDLADNAAAVAWAASYSSLITLKSLGSKDPKVQKVTLASGADDRASIDAEVIAEGLALFTSDLGPGQVAVPGNSAEDVQLAVIAHCDETERTPFLDAEDTDEYSDVIASAIALRSAAGARQGAIFDPWDIAKGVAAGTTRTVPPCARQLGAVAAVDAQTGNASEPAAGDNGKARTGGLVIGLARSRNPEEQEALNDAGVNVSIMDGGVPTTYGWRTLADPVSDQRWLPLNVARVMTGLAYEATAVLKRFLFKRTDAQGKTVAAAEGAIRNEVLKPLYSGNALYGVTEAEAASVTVTQEVSPTDGSVAKLTAEIGAAPVKFAEQIQLTVVATN
jgi:phage tail sheath protein FI